MFQTYHYSWRTIKQLWIDDIPTMLTVTFRANSQLHMLLGTAGNSWVIILITSWFRHLRHPTPPHPSLPPPPGVSEVGDTSPSLFTEADSSSGWVCSAFVCAAVTDVWPCWVCSAAAGFALRCPALTPRIFLEGDVFTTERKEARICSL